MSGKLVLAPRVAARIGVQTCTLAKWRQKGRGPQGWIYLSDTAVAYPEDEVERFLEERRANPPRLGRPPRRAAA